MQVFINPVPLAWRVMVRKIEDSRPFVLYSTYDNLKQAERAVKVISGPPLECRLIPLYPAITNEDLA